MNAATEDEKTQDRLRILVQERGYQVNMCVVERGHGEREECGLMLIN